MHYHRIDPACRNTTKDLRYADAWSIEDSGGAEHRRRWKVLSERYRTKRRPERTHTYSINSRGFRCDEFENCDWQDSVVWFGCSFTFGVGIDCEETVPGQWSQVSGVPTVNLGYPGCSNGRIAHLAGLLLNAVRPRAVVVNWTCTDRLFWNGIDCTPTNMTTRKDTFPDRSQFRAARTVYRDYVNLSAWQRARQFWTHVDAVDQAAQDIPVIHICTGFAHTARLLGQSWFEYPRGIDDFSYDGTHHSGQMNRRHLAHIIPLLNTI